MMGEISEGRPVTVAATPPGAIIPFGAASAVSHCLN